MSEISEVISRLVSALDRVARRIEANTGADAAVSRAEHVALTEQNESLVNDASMRHKALFEMTTRAEAAERMLLGQKAKTEGAESRLRAARVEIESLQAVRAAEIAELGAILGELGPILDAAETGADDA